MERIQISSEHAESIRNLSVIEYKQIKVGEHANFMGQEYLVKNIDFATGLVELKGVDVPVSPNDITTFKIPKGS